MPSLAGDIINPVRRLPKPTGAAEALQPLFEAVSNGTHAVDDAGERQPGISRIDIDITLEASPGEHEFVVADTGVGLDTDRFGAFPTTDTDLKSNRGGKGIGRLLWLDAFNAVMVTSTYRENNRLYRRFFEFALARDEHLLIEERGSSDVATDEFGNLHVDHFIFNKAASADFDGNHQLHLIANGRTVSTRKIDGLIGLGRFGDDGQSVYHGCVTGDFLDERVNQERTNFNFNEEVADQITRACSKAVSEQAIGTEVAAFDATRLETMHSFLREYPSFGAAAALIPTRIRRDVDRNRTSVPPELVAEGRSNPHRTLAYPRLMAAECGPRAILQYDGRQPKCPRRLGLTC